MFQKNNLVTGILIGILLPATAFLMLYNGYKLLEGFGFASKTGLSPDFRERTTAILAIALNLIPLNTYRKRRFENAMRGVVIATSILAFAWVFVYGMRLL